jgi:hypothetical protein
MSMPQTLFKKYMGGGGVSWQKAKVSYTTRDKLRYEAPHLTTTTKKSPKNLPFFLFVEKKTLSLSKPSIFAVC